MGAHVGLSEAFCCAWRKEEKAVEAAPFPSALCVHLSIRHPEAPRPLPSTLDQLSLQIQIIRKDYKEANEKREGKGGTTITVHGLAIPTYRHGLVQV